MEGCGRRLSVFAFMQSFEGGSIGLLPAMEVTHFCMAGSRGRRFSQNIAAMRTGSLKDGLAFGVRDGQVCAWTMKIAVKILGIQIRSSLGQ